jgi:hypothetical protein
MVSKYESAISGIFSKMTTSLTGGSGLDWLETQWGLIQDYSDKYLDTINSAYAIDSTRRKFEDAINDNSGNLKAQQEINDLMEEQLSILEEKEHLTQYDVDRAEKLLDIELKRIALQNAQQNKSTMRLRRDANGNYSYQFVADSDAISEAEQELADARNELYNFDKDAYAQNLQNFYDLYSEYVSQANEIAINYNLSQEEREKQLLELTEKYEDLMSGVIDENVTIRNNLLSSFNDSYEEFYDNTSGSLEDLAKEKIPELGSAIQEMLDAMMESESGFNDLAQSAYDSSLEFMNQYAEDIDKISDALNNVDITDTTNNIAVIMYASQ